MNSKPAFTIWELLCVIVIIALLFALLMPSLNKARSYSVEIVCKSYLRSCSLSGNMYLNDSGNLFPADPNQWLYNNASDSPEHPRACRWHDASMAPQSDQMTRQENWHGSMWQYFAQNRYGACPVFRTIAVTKPCPNPGHIARIDIRPQFNYSLNNYLGSAMPGGVRKLAEVRDPAGVFFFAEENSWTISATSPYSSSFSSYSRGSYSAPLSSKALDSTTLLIPPTPHTANCFATFHNVSVRNCDRGSGNVSFIDGHVDAIRAEDQLRKNMHHGQSRLGPAGNLIWSWASVTPPAGGWDSQ